jgi:hypothetical protein
MRTARGLSRKRRSDAFATILRAKNISPAERKKPGQGKAVTVFAHQLARAVYYRCKRAPAFDMPKCFTG